MRFGYWLPVFGGWLRNVEDERMEAEWSYVRRLARASERAGFDLTLIAELNLNDIKGPDAPALDAWSTAAALADGGGTSHVSSSGVAREAGREHRPHLGRPAVAQCGVIVVGRGSEAIRGRVRHPRCALRAHGRVVDGRRWSVVAAALQLCRQILPRRECDSRAQAGAAATAHSVCRR